MDLLTEVEQRGRSVEGSLFGNRRKRPKTLYHYTSASGLLGIIGSQVIWASDYRHMNDRSELRYSRQMFSDLVDNRLRAGMEPLLGGRLTVLRNILGRANEALHTYVTCFCEEADLLSQWRGYGGPAGATFALGFSSSTVAVLRPSAGCFPGGATSRLYPVLYNEDKQKAYFEGCITAFLDLVPRIEALPDQGRQISVRDHLVNVVGSCVAAGILCFKDPAFFEEREWRLITHSFSEPTSLCYRVQQTDLVPYIEIPLAPHGAKTLGVKTLEEVVVGPAVEAELAERTLPRLLADHGFGGPTVRQSRIPLRT